jgi:hypothetical protein
MYDLGNLGFAILYVCTFAVLGLSVAFVFLHASSHQRSTWFWTLVALIPILGLILYLSYFYYVGASQQATRRKHSRESIAQRMFRPVNVEQRLRQEAIAALGCYRDKEIEKLILKGFPSEARERIEFGIKIAVADKMTSTLETLYYYNRVIDQYLYDQTFPDVLTRLWEAPEAKMELAAEGKSDDMHPD